MKGFGKYLLLGLIGLVWACSSGDDGGGGDQKPVEFDRGAMLANWADNIIVPGYADFGMKVADLKTKTDAFASQKDQNALTALRTSWLNAYSTWQKVDMFEIGPAETLGLRLQVNTYPTNVGTITANITSGSYDLGLSSNRSAKGFPALDYLLFGSGADDAAILDFFDDMASGAARTTYLADVVQDIVSKTEEVVKGWNTYRDTFVNNDGASATASVDKFVNDYIFYYEKFLRAGKMGIPGGVFGNDPDAALIEGVYYRQDLAKDLFLIGLQAVQDFFQGKHYNASTKGLSLEGYLDELRENTSGDDIAAKILTQFNTARTAVTGLDDFYTELSENTPPTDFLSAYDEVQKAVPLLKVEMASAMNIAIDFVDADGD
jgi:predicted lipoprotein